MLFQNRRKALISCLECTVRVHILFWNYGFIFILIASCAGRYSIRDLFDNSTVAYKTASTQNVNLVLDTIRLAMKKEKKAAVELQLHSDQGSQYTSQAYFDLIKEYGITPSISRWGNCCDNAMAENFFSILKTEYIYSHLPATLDEARTIIDTYIYFYNHQRIQLKTGMAPLALRHSS